MGPRRVLATARVALADRLEKRLPAITSPVLVVRGVRDAITTESWCRRVTGLAPGAAMLGGSDARAASTREATLVRLPVADRSNAGTSRHPSTGRRGGVRSS